MEQLIEEIRKIPFLDRIEMVKRMLHTAYNEGRWNPRMSVPAQATDEDIFITQTLMDLEEYYKQSIGLVISHSP